MPPCKWCIKDLNTTFKNLRSPGCKISEVGKPLGVEMWWKTKCCWHVFSEIPSLESWLLQTLNKQNGAKIQRAVQHQDLCCEIRSAVKMWIHFSFGWTEASKVSIFISAKKMLTYTIWGSSIGVWHFTGTDHHYEPFSTFSSRHVCSDSETTLIDRCKLLLIKEKSVRWLCGDCFNVTRLCL